MEQTRALYRLVLTATCLVCLGFNVGMCTKSDLLIKTVVSSLPSSNDDLLHSVPSISKSEWDSLVIKSQLPVMVMFETVWCGPCRAISPFVEGLDSEYSGRFKFYKVDVDMEPSLASRYHVLYIPTFTVFKGGDQVDSLTGANPPALGRLVYRNV